MEVVRTSETSVDNHFTRQYIPEDNSEQKMFPLHTDTPEGCQTGSFSVSLWQPADDINVAQREHITDITSTKLRILRKGGDERYQMQP
jgi:hypothetical protein